MRFLFYFLTLFFLLASCQNNKRSVVKDAVYADYKISGEEGKENITCLFRFYKGTSQSASLFLEPPAGVSFDGTALTVDSARLSGAFYELQKPLADFAGMHTIVFKNSEGVEFKETFHFRPFALASDMGAVMKRDNLILQVDGLSQTGYLRVLLTDTSFATADINEIDTVRNGRLQISQKALQNVASGPVTLYLFKEEERPLKKAPGAGGSLSVTYGLSREFELADN